MYTIPKLLYSPKGRMSRGKGLPPRICGKYFVNPLYKWEKSCYNSLAVKACAGGSMDRASDSGSEGWGFESLPAYHRRGKVRFAPAFFCLQQKKTPSTRSLAPPLLTGPAGRRLVSFSDALRPIPPLSGLSNILFACHVVSQKCPLCCRSSTGVILWYPIGPLAGLPATAPLWARLRQ